ncbi:D-2-hydroxyacid dehydrogenase [Reinekea forsetii]|nr:D-2-hydroxyacid dehydrogenase [Reinekea forsetii]
MKAIFLDRATFPSHVNLTVPKQISDWVTFDNLPTQDIIQFCSDADIILTNKVELTEDTINLLPKLKLICIMATGTNNVDLEACFKKKVQVVNAVNYGAASVAEHTLMLMLALARNLPRYLDSHRSKQWSKSPYFYHYAGRMQSLTGKTLTIIGKGVLGLAVAQRAQAIGMNILFAEHQHSNSIRDGYTPFNDALQQADVLSLHCPLTPQTKHLINKATLALLKPSCILINTGRGGLINEKDLLVSLTNKQILAAGLDVATQEPPAEIDTIWQLEKLNNVILTPHVAWAADDSMQNLLDQISQKIQYFLEQKPIENIASAG